MKHIYFAIVLFTVKLSIAQTNFSVQIEADSISGMPALQSFAFAQHNGKWLLIGGRTDGLHRRQPPFAFLSSGNNVMVYVVDPVNKQVWNSTLSSLPVSVQEQLQSTNMQFTQLADTLYITGGYGYSATANDHITFPSLSIIQVDSIINAIINNQSITSHIRQINDIRMAVTGGHLATMGNKLFLVGGHKFDGRYNPMNGPSFVQVYTNQIRSFEVLNAGSMPVINNYNGITDAVNLHRRDYNLSPQIFPNGTYGLTIFSGVFQQGADLPFLNSVDVYDTGYYVNNTFNQYLSHYHCANTGVYDAQGNQMHTLFFGGMSQYYIDASGTLVQNDSVPFVNTISKVTRIANGQMTESKIGEMPGLLGAGAEFLFNESLPTSGNGILDLNATTSDTILLGFIVGGINSTQPNIFWINTGTESVASSYIYKVWLIKNTPGALNDVLVNGQNPLQVSVYPNPASDRITVKYLTSHTAEVTITIQNENGQILNQFITGDIKPGLHETNLHLEPYNCNMLLLTVSDGVNLSTIKVSVLK